MTSGPDVSFAPADGSLLVGRRIDHARFENLVVFSDCVQLQQHLPSNLLGSNLGGTTSETHTFRRALPTLVRRRPC